MQIYQTPWCTSLKIESLLLVILAVAALFGSAFLPVGQPWWSVHLASWLLPVIVLGCLPFLVCGYEIIEDAIRLRRSLWKTRLERAGLKSAEVALKAISQWLRTCGNGGGFSFTGCYWSRSFGRFSAYVTDLERTVVLRFDKRTVVVSHVAAEPFVKELG
jgi:hypothetical protein